MKIAVINNIYPPYDRGGAEQVVVKTVEGLIAAGHEVVVITSTPKIDEIERRKHLSIHRIHPRNLFFYTEANYHNFFARLVWHLIDIFNFGAAKKVKKILEIEKPDAVHTHNLMGLSFLVPKIIRELKTRHVHTVHDVQLVEPSAMILKNQEHAWRYNGWPTKLYSWLMKKLIESPNVVIAPSQFIRDFYTRRGFFKNSNVEVVRNPVTFTSGSIAKNIQMKPDSIFRFIYVGQIETHKGVADLVRAFRQLTDENVQLHIVGGGSQLKLIQQLADADKRIKMYGRIDRKELPLLFSKMNMTVVPSLCYENSPTVIFESFACGVPVLASNIEGIAELIKEGENGFTFLAGNETELKNKLEWCLQNQEKVNEMSNETANSLAGLSLEEYVERLVVLFNE